MNSIDRIMPREVPGMLETKDLKWHSPKEVPFRVHGLYAPEAEGGYRRLPAEVAAVSENVSILAGNTAGGRVRNSTE